MGISPGRSKAAHPKEQNLQTLKNIRQKLQSIAERDRKEGKTQYLDRVERLIDTIDWVTLYDEAAMQVLQAQAKSATDKKAAAEMLLKAPLGKSHANLHSAAVYPERLGRAGHGQRQGLRGL